RPVAGGSEPDLYAVGTAGVVGARVLEGSRHDELLQRLYVPTRDLVWDGELLRDLERDPHLGDVQARVWADDGPAGKVDPLAGEGTPEPSFLALQPLA